MLVHFFFLKFIFWPLPKSLGNGLENNVLKDLPISWSYNPVLQSTLLPISINYWDTTGFYVSLERTVHV